MATKTEIYELRKKEENDFYNIEDFNNNMDTLEKALTEFDDSGTAEGVTSFPEMLTKLVTGNKLAITLKNLKAGLQFVLHAGSIVNNCVTDNANLPVSAAMAKSLQDQINQANSNISQLTEKSVIDIQDRLNMTYIKSVESAKLVTIRNEAQIVATLTLKEIPNSSQVILINNIPAPKVSWMQDFAALVTSSGRAVPIALGKSLQLWYNNGKIEDGTVMVINSVYII